MIRDSIGTKKLTNSETKGLLNLLYRKELKNLYIWNMGSRAEILLKIRNAVLSTEPGAKVILYGSFARGDNQDGSDMDILILVNKEHISRQDEKRIKYPLYEIEFDSGQIISPVVLPVKEWETRHKITPFYQNVLSEGIEL